MDEQLRPKSLCSSCVENGVSALFVAQNDEGYQHRRLPPHFTKSGASLEDHPDRSGSPGASVRIGGVADKVVELGIASHIKSRISCPFCEMVNQVLVPELLEPPYEKSVIYAEKSRMTPTFGLAGPANRDLIPPGDAKIFITFRGGEDSPNAVITLGCFQFKSFSEGKDDPWVTKPGGRRDPFPDIEHATSASQARELLGLYDKAQHILEAAKKQLVQPRLRSAGQDGAALSQEVQETSTPCAKEPSEVLDNPEGYSREPDESSDSPASPSFNILLIDVKERCLVDRSTAETYVALSYVWGGDQKAKLYTNNRRELQTSRALDTLEMSKVVKDAMDFTADLGHSYLWVDALCIEQNDDSQQKKEQLRIMDRIYGSSYVTLVAWTASCSNSPLPGVGSTKLQPQVMIRVIDSPSGQVRTPILLENRVTSDLEHLAQYENISHYDTRAWTLQERLLSKRCLLFHHRETLLCFQSHGNVSRVPITFGVNSLYGVGRDLFGFTQIIGDDPDNLEAFAREAVGLTGSHAPHLASYSRLIESYSRLSLTNPTDRVTAVTGILDFLKPLVGDTVQGMPISHLPLSLAWTQLRHVGDNTRNIHFPSWTWAGWNAEVHCQGSYFSDIIVEIPEIHGSESVNGPRRLLYGVYSTPSTTGLGKTQAEPELSTISVLHFSARTASAEHCWFGGSEGRSNHSFVTEVGPDEYDLLGGKFDLDEMERMKTSCGFVLLSHVSTPRRKPHFTTLLVRWNGSEASRICSCHFTEEGFKRLNWVEKDISLV